MKVYNYHPETKEYLGFDFADESPLEPGKYLVPAHATDIEPPEPALGKILKFDIINQVWRQVCIEFSAAKDVIEMTDEQKMNIIRQERNRSLYLCDWTQLKDVTLSIAKDAEWTAYRQALRDFPATVDLDNIMWPAPPGPGG